MKDSAIIPDAGRLHPSPNSVRITHVRPTITNPNIIVGEFTYFEGDDFERHVTHHYPFNGDKLHIGKFCQIAAGVEFVMNGANHQLGTATTFPFFIFEGWSASAPTTEDLGLRGDTIVGNDVWIGQNATILPGVHIGDGAVIGLNSTVSGDVKPYTVVAGNPARLVRRRFDDELTRLLLELRWWDKPVDEIDRLIPLLTCNDLERVKARLKSLLGR